MLTDQVSSTKSTAGILTSAHKSSIENISGISKMDESLDTDSIRESLETQSMN